MITFTKNAPVPAHPASPAPAPPAAPAPKSAPSGGTAVHRDAVRTAEGTRQSAVAAAGGIAATQASLRSIDIAFHKAVIASAFANNGGAGIGPSMEALRSLQGTAT
jgi:hypothetical protein